MIPPNKQIKKTATFSHIISHIKGLVPSNSFFPQALEDLAGCYHHPQDQNSIRKLSLEIEAGLKSQQAHQGSVVKFLRAYTQVPDQVFDLNKTAYYPNNKLNSL